MATDLSGPIILDFKSAQKDVSPTSFMGKQGFQPLRTFTSYSFDRSLLSPASPFRFTAPGVDPDIRKSIRSGDLVELFVLANDGTPKQIATGFIDETDTHVNPTSVEYVLTGRDTIGQFVDNACVDANNKIVNTRQADINFVMDFMIKNTRCPAGYTTQQLPNTKTLIFQTVPGQTKIDTLQRYLEFTNCLVWSAPNGQIVVGKPDFTQEPSGSLILNRENPSANNVLEARVRRNVNTSIRKIVTQLQTLNLVDAGSYTVNNQDEDMLATQDLVGRSVYRTFNYGNGEDAVNQVLAVGNSSGNPRNIGNELSAREVARENMKILDVEIVVRGHLNEDDEPFDIDQVYSVQITDDDVEEDMYVYSVRYDLTIDKGRLTTLRLCRLGTIVAFADQIQRVVR